MLWCLRARRSFTGMPPLPGNVTAIQFGQGSPTCSLRHSDRTQSLGSAQARRTSVAGSLPGGPVLATGGSGGEAACESPESVSLGPLPSLPSLPLSASSPGAEPLSFIIHADGHGQSGSQAVTLDVVSDVRRICNLQDPECLRSHERIVTGAYTCICLGSLAPPSLARSWLADDEAELCPRNRTYMRDTLRTPLFAASQGLWLLCQRTQRDVWRFTITLYDAATPMRARPRRPCSRTAASAITPLAGQADCTHAVCRTWSWVHYATIAWHMPD